ncbi:MAG: lamin tail domain-containing protein, partial [Bacteroidia bacterium]|nr:lamin tail domain-containing protein [Bacteroidia bacterium]
MKKVLLSLSLLVACVSLKSQCSELFFSRYIQLGQSNKGFEIYNPTPNPINLTGYRIERWKANGSGLISTTMSDSLHLTAGAMIPAYGTWTLTNPEQNPATAQNASICDTALWLTADQHGNYYGTWGSSTGDPTYFKGNDCLILRNPAGNIIDVFGEIGVTVTYWSTLPTYRGGIGEGKWVSKGYLLERRSSVNAGVTSIPSSFNPMAQWDTIPRPLTLQDTLDTYAIMGSPFTSVCMVGMADVNVLSRVSVYPNP